MNHFFVKFSKHNSQIIKVKFSKSTIKEFQQCEVTIQKELKLEEAAKQWFDVGAKDLKERELKDGQEGWYYL